MIFGFGVLTTGGAVTTGVVLAVVVVVVVAGAAPLERASARPALEAVVVVLDRLEVGFLLDSVLTAFVVDAFFGAATNEGSNAPEAVVLVGATATAAAGVEAVVVPLDPQPAKTTVATTAQLNGAMRTRRKR
jgi:hypothetical protein